MYSDDIQMIAECFCFWLKIMEVELETVTLPCRKREIYLDFQPAVNCPVTYLINKEF